MLAWSLKKGDRVSAMLMAGLSIGIWITWIQTPIFITLGAFTYAFTALLISLLNVKALDLSRINHFAIVLSGLWAFGSNLAVIMNWPYASLIRLSVIFPLSIYVISLFNGMLGRKEFGYLTLLNTDFLLRLIL